MADDNIKRFAPVDTEGDEVQGDWRRFYTATTVQRLAELEKQQVARGSLEGDYLVETDQNAEWQTFDLGCVPCLCSSSRIYSFTHHRHMVPNEHLLVQGMPTMAGSDMDFRLPWGSALELGLLGRRQILQLAANSMHAQVVGSLLVYILSRLHAHAVVSMKAHKLLATATTEVVFDDEGLDAEVECSE